jgi:formate hydrogenlyase subunit 4
MELFWSLFYFLIFPGFIFTACIGLITPWINRKVTARMQYRKGPPLFSSLFKMKIYKSAGVYPAPLLRFALL